MMEWFRPPLKFPQTFIDEVRAAADIVTVISDTVSLRKAGNAYKGLVPVSRREDAVVQRHARHAASSTASAAASAATCSSSSSSRKRSASSRRSGISRRASAFRFRRWNKRGEQRETAAEREALVKIHEVALAYFREQLATPAGARWREYLLKERGLTQETIDQLQIGWAPPSRDALRQRLLKAGFSPIQTRDERPGLAPRRWQRGRSIQESPDDSDRARYRHGDRVRRPRARGGSAAEVSELAGDADLHEEPHALRAQPDQGVTCAKATSR